MILEVQDSKGKSCGRVVAQVATVADDPVIFLILKSVSVEPHLYCNSQQ